MHLTQNVFLPNAATVAADEIGAFAAEGVEVSTTFTKSSLDQRAALLDRSCDVAVTALDNLFDWNRVDTDGFRAVAQIERTTSLPVYLAGAASLAELADRPLVRVVVDSPASGFGIALVALVDSLGVGPDRREVIAAGGVNERLAALAAGEGDIALLAPFVAAAAAAAGLSRVSALEDIYPTYPGLVVVLDATRLPEHGDAVRAYLRALAAARRWMQAEPGAALAALIAAGLTEPAARTQLTLCGGDSLTVSTDGFALLRRLRIAQGLLPARPCDYPDLVSNLLAP